MANLIGARLERKEDKKFLTGKGRYTADINLTNQTYAYFVRSPHARAKISKLDHSKAMKAPGVIDVYTVDCVIKDKIGGLICGWKIVRQDGKDMKCPPHPVLAKDVVNFVGDHVAVVVADDAARGYELDEDRRSFGRWCGDKRTFPSRWISGDGKEYFWMPPRIYRIGFVRRLVGTSAGWSVHHPFFEKFNENRSFFIK